MKKIVFIITWPLKQLLLGLIYGIRPFLGPSNCKYYVSCTDYGIQQLNDEPVHKAVWNITKRLVNCANPFKKEHC